MSAEPFWVEVSWCITYLQRFRRVRAGLEAQTRAPARNQSPKTKLQFLARRRRLLTATRSVSLANNPRIEPLAASVPQTGHMVAYLSERHTIFVSRQVLAQ